MPKQTVMASNAEALSEAAPHIQEAAKIIQLEPNNAGLAIQGASATMPPPEPAAPDVPGLNFDKPQIAESICPICGKPLPNITHLVRGPDGGNYIVCQTCRSFGP